MMWKSSRESPPAPVFSRCVPRGMIGYEDFKKEQMKEAKADRRRAERPPDPHALHLAKLKRYFPER
jgi:hypothetical protein